MLVGIIISVGAGALYLAWFVSRAFALADAFDEMRPARKTEVGKSEQGGRAGRGHVRTHDSGGF